MQIDFYYWGNMCPLSEEIIRTLSSFNTQFDIRLHDITNDFATAKSNHIFFPFLTVVNSVKRYYSPISQPFLQSLCKDIFPQETPSTMTLGTLEKEVMIQPITQNNYFLASQCTARRRCPGCEKKLSYYQNLTDEIIGFMNTDGDILLGGAEYFPSLYVPYDIPKGPEIAFITCVYLSHQTYDYKSAPLRKLEQYLSRQYKKAVVISDEKGTFPNGDSEFFHKNGYHDEKVLFEDAYCKLHLFAKDLA